MTSLGQDRSIGALFVLALLLLIFKKGVDLAGKHRQLALRQIERVVAGGREKCPIVRDDQAGLAMIAEEMLQQNLRAQVEKVRRLVEQQQVRLVQQQRGQFEACLPAAGELGDRPLELRTFQLELAGHFAAFPIGLTAVAHQKLQAGFAGKKRIVLTQITQLQFGVPNDFAAIEFFFAQQNAKQGAFTGAVATDKADFSIVDDGRLSIVKQHLVAIAFAGVFNLQQYGHQQIASNEEIFSFVDFARNQYTKLLKCILISAGALEFALLDQQFPDSSRKLIRRLDTDNG